MSDFVLGFLGFETLVITFEPQTIVQSWLSAANATDIGTAAAMGPIVNLDVLGITLGICGLRRLLLGQRPSRPHHPSEHDQRLVVYQGLNPAFQPPGAK